MTDRLMRGVDPYADANETAARSGHIDFLINAVDYAAGTAQQIICPCDGYLRELAVVVQEATTGAGVVTLTANGAAQATVAVAGGAAVGVFGNKRIPDNAAATGNKVKKGQIITVAVDATPTAGAVRGVIHIDSGTRAVV